MCFVIVQKPLQRLQSLLVDSLSSQVLQINADDSSVVIDPPVKWRTDIPICVKGQPVAPIHVEEDQLWVESLAPFEVGMELRPN